MPPVATGLHAFLRSRANSEHAELRLPDLLTPDAILCFSCSVSRGAGLPHHHQQPDQTKPEKETDVKPIKEPDIKVTKDNGCVVS